MSHQPADLPDAAIDANAPAPPLVAVPADPPELADLAAMAAHDLVEPLRAAAERLDQLEETHGAELPEGPRELLTGARADVEHLGHMVATAERTLSYPATHDPLTGLPNRALLLEELDAALERASTGGGVPAVAHLGIDEFK